MNSRAASVLAGALATFVAAAALAQSGGERPIRLVSPYAPGGSNDIAARLVARKLGEVLKTSVIVENRPGGGMRIGSELVARAPADGHALLFASSGHAVNPSLQRDLPYDTLRDFTPVSLVGWMPNVVVVHPALPVRQVEDLVAHARATPGGLHYSSAGSGSTPHLATEWFRSVAGIALVHVPYKGTGPSLADLVGGQVAFTICGIAPALPYMRSGKLRPIAVTSAKRTPLAPELPTVAERGYPGFDVVTWYGILGPAKLPPARVTALSAAIREAVRAPDMAGPLGAQGIDAVAGTPAEFDAFIRAEMARWAKVVEGAGIKPE